MTLIQGVFDYAPLGDPAETPFSVDGAKTEDEWEFEAAREAALADERRVEQSYRTAAYATMTGPREWIERCIAVAVTERKGVWHASHTVAIMDGKASDYTNCICTPCSRERGTRF